MNREQIASRYGVEEIERRLKANGLPILNGLVNTIEAILREAVEAEREACCGVVHDELDSNGQAKSICYAIRARGEVGK